MGPRAYRPAPSREGTPQAHEALIGGAPTVRRPRTPPSGWPQRKIAVGKGSIRSEMRLWCQECGQPSGPEAKGWRLYRTDVPEEGEEPSLAAYCDVCAYVEFGSSSREPTESD
jgi:hypothetical protein